MPRPFAPRKFAPDRSGGGPSTISRRGFVLGAAAGMTALGLGAAVARADTGARVVSERYVGERLLDLTISSPALAATVPVRLLLPASWTPAPKKTWPVLYLLHGSGDDYTSWTRSTDVEELTGHSEMLVVMPSAGRDGFYSDWLNHGAGGPPRWETFHLTELREILERSYGAGTVRAIAGLSMGGFGAMSYAGRHPGMFRAAAAYSGLLHTTYQNARGSSLIQGVLVKDGYDPFALWGDPILNADVWAAHNPYMLADRLVGIPLYVACGNGQPGALDPPGAPPDVLIEPLCYEESAAFADRVRALGGSITTELYGPGTHNWPWWQRDLHHSFPLLAAAIGAADG
ncbi:alpha/beta hydrolase [Amycolatopsis sp. NPDC059027]|uniref:alpha/beta hydrolase n=1 Tax=unclassified Amycolatopsis TaxID=2618356 RepID=UPI00366D00DE